MGFWDFLKSENKQEKSVTLNPIAAQPAQLIFRMHGGAPVIYYADSTETYLRNGFEQNHVVFTIADWCAKKMTIPPPILYRTKNKNAAKRYHAIQKAGGFDNISDAVKLKNAAFEEIESHPILDVLKSPNPLMNWDEFVYGYFIFKQFVGNSVIQGVWTDNGLNKGKIQQLYLLPSNYIRAVSGQGLNVIDHYIDERYPTEKIMPEQVCVIRNFSADYQVAGSHLSGMSILKAAKRQLKKSNEALDAETEALQNRGASSLIFPDLKPDFDESMLPDGKTIDTLNEDMRKRLKEAGNQGIVLNSVPLRSIQIGMSPVDLQILETQKFDIQTWASLFHVDSRVLLNDHQSSTKDNMQAARLNSLTDGVIPHLIALANALNGWLVKSYGEDNLFLDFDTTVFPEVQRQLRDTAKEMSDTGAFTVDEIREIWKYGNYTGENGDKILVGSNKQILDDLSNTLPDTADIGGAGF